MKTLIYILILCMAAPAWATAGSKEGREYYNRGSKLYSMGYYKEAAEEFEKSYQAFPTPVMYFNLARAHDNAGNTKKALRYYRGYIKHCPEGNASCNLDHKTTAARRIMALEPTAKPPVARTAPPKPQPVPMPLPVDMPQQSRLTRPWAWIATGAGVAAITAGSVLLATRKVDDWRRDGNGQIVSDTDPLWPGPVLVAAGVASAAVGTWLFLRDETPPKVQVGLMGPGVLVQGTF